MPKKGDLMTKEQELEAKTRGEERRGEERRGEDENNRQRSEPDFRGNIPMAPERLDRGGPRDGRPVYLDQPDNVLKTTP